MPKLCRVTVMFETLLDADPLEEMPKSAEDDEKLKEIEKVLLRKHPTLVGCSDVKILKCVEHTLAEPEEPNGKDTEYGKAMMPEKGR